MVALRRSSRVATADEDHSESRRAPEPRARRGNEPKWPQHAVQLREEDAQKLITVLSSAAPRLLEAPVDKQCTLRSVLEHGSSLQQLWAYTKALCAAEHGAAVRIDATAHASLLLLQHFLLELAQHYDEMPSRPTQETNAYALHMHLPMGEFFTNAVNLDGTSAQALDTGHAELVAVAPPIGQEPPPTFGERIPRGTRLKARPKNDLKPSTFLSYGPYCSSLAPAYDSTGAMLDARTTEEVWQAQVKHNTTLRRRWGPGLARRAERMFAEAQSTRASEVPHQASHELAQLAASLDPALDASVLQEGIAQLDLDRALAENWEALEELQELQWLRTRMDHGAPTEHAAVSAQEQACAAELLTALTQLLLRAPTDSGHAVRAAAPLWSRSVAVLSKSLEGAALPGFWGTLPDHTFGMQTKTYLNSTAAPTAPGAPQQATWAALVRPRMLADTATARWEQGSAPGALAAAATAHAGAPGEAVQRAFAAPSYPRPVPPGSYALGSYAAAHSPYARVGEGRTQ